ncbi:MAG TPA: response regulator transcription factor, partial [Candidatus Bathyarchaeia archaeon]|nr:response regulator transcription factor [Candidatus Bathyarchaeia archaeon]
MGVKKHILVVEDDKHISKLIRYNLEKEGYDCTMVITGEEALDVLDTTAIDLIILDIMLPKMDGFEVCKLIRQNKATVSVPLIMLTARGEEIDRIIGFELGADDYMAKPFSPRELILRIKAVLKRGRASESEKDILEAGDIVIDLPRHVVKVDGRKIELSPMEFKLLTTLIKRRGRVQSRDVLLDDVWGLSSDVTTRTVDTHVKLL